LTSALDGGEWSASCLGHFTPREGAPITHWIGNGYTPAWLRLYTLTQVKVFKAPSGFDFHKCRREDNIKMGLREKGVRVETGFIWLRIGTSGGHL
jgi:hypothetical protein